MLKHRINPHDTRNTYACRHLPEPLLAMHSHRQTEANILGYRLDRIEGGMPDTRHYEVSAPDTDTAIASFLDRPSAEQFIVLRELRTIATRPRNPAY